ncbi:hypothetical protein ACFX5K_00115 [Rickettsiales bacterium LUAb2]
MINHNISYYIDFNDLQLDFSNTYYNNISFSLNNKQYNWQVIFNSTTKELLLYDLGNCCTKAISNTVLNHSDFNFILINQSDPLIRPILVNELFKKYRLAILDNKG